MDFDPWLNREGEFVHPYAPAGSGGPGFFFGCRIWDGDGYDLPPETPHPLSPAGRHITLNHDLREKLKHHAIHRHNRRHKAETKQDPYIRTLYGPADLGYGEVAWRVWYELPYPAPSDGWIVQWVQRSYDIWYADGSADTKLNSPHTPYWEAWEVKKGKRVTVDRDAPTDTGEPYDDSFDQPSREDSRGEFKVRGVVKFYALPSLPASFIANNPATAASDLRSTVHRPDFWDGTGTTHDLTVTWDCRSSSSPSQITATAGSNMCKPIVAVPATMRLNNRP